MSKPRSLVELFSTPGTWTQGAFARTVEGQATSAFSKEATCFCLSGALRFIYIDNEEQCRAYNKLEALLKPRVIPPEKDYSPVVFFNDEVAKTQEEILALCKEAHV